MLTQLKQATRPYHESLDALPVLRRLMASDLEVREYVSILEKFYGLYRPLEEKLAPFIAFDRWKLDLESRRRTPKLVADLHFLGSDLQAVPLAPDLPKIEDWPDAWGLLYVLEGSTLGAQVISRQIARTLGLRDHGGQFFQAHGPGATREKWQQFCQSLQKWAETQPDHARVFTAACSSFQAFERWLSPREAEP